MDALFNGLGTWGMNMAGFGQRMGFIAFLVVAAFLLVGAIVRGESGLMKFFTHIGASAFALALLVSVVALVLVLIGFVPGAPKNIFTTAGTGVVQTTAAPTTAGG